MHNELLKAERDKFTNDKIPLGLGSEFEEVEPILIESESAKEHFCKNPPLLQSQQSAQVPADFLYRQLINKVVESDHNPWRQRESEGPQSWDGFLREYKFVLGFTYSGYLLSPQDIRNNGGGILSRFHQTSLGLSVPYSCVDLLDATEPFYGKVIQEKNNSINKNFFISCVTASARLMCRNFLCIS